MRNAHVSTFLTLRCINSVKTHQMVMVLWPLFECVNLFLTELLLFSLNLSHIVSQDLDPIGLRFKGLYFGSYQDLACTLLIFSLQMKPSHKEVQQVFTKKILIPRLSVKFKGG